MKKKLIMITIATAIVLTGIMSLIVYYNNRKQAAVVNNPATSSEEGVVAGSTTEPYFDENAPVMYFYSELCSWCKKEAEILKALAPEGYRVKPMDVKAHPDYWQKFNVSGTPTFIAPDGTKTVGYQDKDKLKKLLDQYK